MRYNRYRKSFWHCRAVCKVIVCEMDTKLSELLGQVWTKAESVGMEGWLSAAIFVLGFVLVVIVWLTRCGGVGQGFWMMGKNDACEYCRAEVDALRADGAALRCSVKRMVAVERELRSDLRFAGDRERHLRSQVSELQRKLGRMEKELQRYRRREEWELHTCASTGGAPGGGGGGSVTRRRTPSERHLLGLKPNMEACDDDDDEFDMAYSPISPAPTPTPTPTGTGLRLPGLGGLCTTTTTPTLKKRRTAPFAMKRAPWANCEKTPPTSMLLAIVENAQCLVAHRH